MPQLIRAAAVLIAAAFVFSLNVSAGRQTAAAPAATASSNAERHLRNIRKLTSGGENAEAYFSADGTRLIYQSTRPDYPCDQIYTMKLDGTDSAPRQHRHGPDDLRLFLSGGRRDPVRVHA